MEEGMFLLYPDPRVAMKCPIRAVPMFVRTVFELEPWTLGPDDICCATYQAINAVRSERSRWQREHMPTASDPPATPRSIHPDGMVFTPPQRGSGRGCA
jgi:hypothetical protein